MNSKKFIIISVVLASITLSACKSIEGPRVSQPPYNPPNGNIDTKLPTDIPTDPPTMLGGDRDEHGCIPSAGYQWDEEKGLCVRSWEKDKEEPEENIEPVGIANPASVNCEEKGGTLTFEEKENGTIGICNFIDGSSCEEWVYLRGECKERDSNFKN